MRAWCLLRASLPVSLRHPRKSTISEVQRHLPHGHVVRYFRPALPPYSGTNSGQPMELRGRPLDPV